MHTDGISSDRSKILRLFRLRHPVTREEDIQKLRDAMVKVGFSSDEIAEVIASLQVRENLN